MAVHSITPGPINEEKYRARGDGFLKRIFTEIIPERNEAVNLGNEKTKSTYANDGIKRDKYGTPLKNQETGKDYYSNTYSANTHQERAKEVVGVNRLASEEYREENEAPDSLETSIKRDENIGDYKEFMGDLDPRTDPNITDIEAGDITQRTFKYMFKKYAKFAQQLANEMANAETLKRNDFVKLMHTIKKNYPELSKDPNFVRDIDAMGEQIMKDYDKAQAAHQGSFDKIKGQTQKGINFAKFVGKAATAVSTVKAAHSGGTFVKSYFDYDDSRYRDIEANGTGNERKKN